MRKKRLRAAARLNTSLYILVVHTYTYNNYFIYYFKTHIIYIILQYICAYLHTTTA